MVDAHTPNQGPADPTAPGDRVRRSSLFDALLNRRSRRFGTGMEIPQGPLAYRSTLPPQPLTEEEEAAIVFAGAGITGSALADVSFGHHQGGTMIASLFGRTVSSPDAIQTAALVVTNDEATYLIRRPDDFPPGEIPGLIALARAGDLTELYRRLRLMIKPERTAPPLKPRVNFTVNHWSLYAKGGTYFLPISDATRFYINGVMEMFDEGMDLFVVDERAGLQPAGLRKFGKSVGGKLQDDPRLGQTATVAQIELVISEMLAIEMGMMLQNISLMAQGIGLGAWPSFARHEAGWFDALGFRMATMPGTQFVGAGPTISFLARALKRDVESRFALGLEIDGEPVLKPYCPPYYPSMRAAVEAVAAEKFGPNGVWRSGTQQSAWLDSKGAAEKIPAVADHVVEATAAFCQYLYDRYGRFPVYMTPFFTIIGMQVTHLDTAFYDRFYRPDALSETQREHNAIWHR